jgi:hypothetical protein
MKLQTAGEEHGHVLALSNNVEHSREQYHHRLSAAMALLSTVPSHNYTLRECGCISVHPH